MNRRRFITDSGPDAASLTVCGEEYHHLRHVMRVKVDDEIELVNGRGDWFLGRVSVIGSRHIEARPLKHACRPIQDSRIIMAPSLLKKRPMDLLVEKLTEMGVHEIRPVIFDRTDVRYSPSMMERWQRIALQSIKVNRRLWTTRITEPVQLENLLEQCSGPSVIILDIDGSPLPPEQLSGHVTCITGPPGDFSAKERHMLENSCAYRWSISSSILKSETAAISGCAILSSFAALRNP